jgi:putative DNA methylase
MIPIKIPKKLIEVALPLDDINVAAAREKSIRHGHPSTLHLWWARRPLAAARAVIFAQMVNDPGFENGNGFQRGLNKKEAEKKREELFQIIRDLVKWENTNNEEVLNRAREAIKESWRETCAMNKNHPQAKELFDPEKLPAFHDPFAGGGAIPLEAQRLGLESYASDLNPVAVMINKAMIEIPPKFAGRSPVGPVPAGEKQSEMPREWQGAQGLAEDVRRYGHWIREEAFKRIGHLYPKVKVTEEIAKDRPDLRQYVGQELTVIAWLWARTVKSPNPAFSNVDVPLASTFVLSSKDGKEVYVDPIIEGDTYRFTVKVGKATETVHAGTTAGKRAAFVCLMSGSPVDYNYIRAEGKAGRMGQKLMAIVAEGARGRVYLPPVLGQQEIAYSAQPEWRPNVKLHGKCRVNVSNYGLDEYGDLFTSRQLVALSMLCDLVHEARKKTIADAIKLGFENDQKQLSEGGIGATAYGDALAVYLSFAINRTTNTLCTIARWTADRQQTVTAFARQAIPMTWDYPEVNPFANAAGDYFVSVEGVIKGIPNISEIAGIVTQADATNQNISIAKVISTDPPYYDNIGYADLSDFFYVWMRRSLNAVYPALFATLAVPKAEELIATPYRHGSKEKAEAFFMNGMTQAMQNLAVQAHPAFPVSIYYAFKQSETKEGSTSNTGWETFLEAVLEAGFSIDGTWPMRTEMANRMIGSGANALASSIVLVCQKRPEDAGSISRRDFQRELREQMPEALQTMIGGETGQTPIAPVDLAQAAIGPGMAIFSKYASVLNQDGSKMSVHEALIMINKEITEFLNPESGNFDADTLFCSTWFDQNGWAAGAFGDADNLSRAKGTSVDGVKESGVIESGSGKVRLLKWAEYPAEWDPTKDERTPIWEACHHMIRKLNQQGEGEAGALLANMPDKGESIRQLAYHLYTLCERKKWADDARAYNELVTAWHAIVTASHDVGHKGSQVELELDLFRSGT